MLSVSIHRLLLLLCALVGMATTELVHVSVLFRHGHRSPVQLLPSQNFTVDNYWKDGLGELTNIGKMNEFNLGQFLRKRYDAFLGSRYNSSAHYVRSTDFDRTLMSAQSCLAGLFPPVGDQRWNSQLPWQPIPVHTVPKAKDYLLEAPDFPCPERERQFKQVNADPARLQFYRPYADFLKRLSAGAGMAVTPASVHKVLDTLWINKVEGLPAPAWLNYSGPDWQRLVTVGSFQWNEYSWTPDLVRFGSGRLLDEILGTMDNISHGRLPDRGARLRLYSDHDTTVASALAALGNTEFVWPDFASAVLFELHSDSGQFSLKFFFSNGTGSQRQLFTLPPPGCPKPGQPCPLASALAGLAPMRLSLPELIKRCR
uniref:Lysosomal acid phosphatase n=1 Tax=Macrostomum lignano TaxID=282301 RepID=A0A1I8I0A6_9PLAT